MSERQTTSADVWIAAAAFPDYDDPELIEELLGIYTNLRLPGMMTNPEYEVQLFNAQDARIGREVIVSGMLEHGDANISSAAHADEATMRYEGLCLDEDDATLMMQFREQYGSFYRAGIGTIAMRLASPVPSATKPETDT